MPLTIFWLILLAGLLFYLLKRKRTALVCGFFSIVWLGMISSPFLPDLLVRSLETRFPPLLEISKINPKDSVNILVLGAGYTDNKNLPPNDQLSSTSLARLSEAIRLHRLLNKSLLVLSGSMPGQKVSEAELFMQTAMALDVEENKIRLLGTPKNTRMEASEYTRKFGTNTTLVTCHRCNTYATCYAPFPKSRTETNRGTDEPSGEIKTKTGYQRLGPVSIEHRD